MLGSVLEEFTPLRQFSHCDKPAKVTTNAHFICSYAKCFITSLQLRLDKSPCLKSQAGIRRRLAEMQCSLRTDVLNKVFSVANAFCKPVREQLGGTHWGQVWGEIERGRENRWYKVPLPNNFRNFIISLENICPEFLDMHEGGKGSEGFWCWNDWVSNEWEQQLYCRVTA